MAEKFTYPNDALESNASKTTHKIIISGDIRIISYINPEEFSIKIIEESVRINDTTTGM